MPVRQKWHTDPAVAAARSRFASAVRDCNEDLAVRAARELIRARRAYRVRKDLEAMAEAGQGVDEVMS
jgi:hypothetical protein